MRIPHKAHLLVWSIGGIFLGLYALSAAGFGHGTYIPLTVLFPYVMLSFVLPEYLREPFLILIPIQYPVYGILITTARNTGREAFRRMMIWIVSVHCMTVLFGFFILYLHR